MKPEYSKWIARWKIKEPNKNPPTEKEFNEICEMFDFTSQELGIEEKAE